MRDETLNTFMLRLGVNQFEDYSRNERSQMLKQPAGTLTDIKCPRCGGKLVVRKNSKTGDKFFGCCNYPECSKIATANDLYPGTRRISWGRKKYTKDAEKMGYPASYEELEMQEFYW